MNSQQKQYFMETLRRYRNSFFGLGAGFCYLLAGPSHIDAATPADARKPLKTKPNIGKLIDEAEARCANKSLLDRLQSARSKVNLLESSDDDKFLGGGDDCPGLPVSGSIYSDSGTTLGGNNTNNAVPATCNGSYTQTAGPDKIYQITLPPIPSRTGGCTVTVDPTGANWDPSIYVLTNCTDGNTCPAGGGDDNGGSNVTESVNLSTFAGGTYYFFVDSFYATGALSAGSYDLTYNCPAALGGTDNCPGLPVSGNIFTDSGTTLGANNTNNAVPASCNGSYTQTAGPDKIYQIYIPPVATRTGTCSITVDPTGANWDPSIYVLTNCTDGNTCGPGLGDDNGGSNVTEVVNITPATPGGTYYFFVDSFYATGALSAGSYDLTYSCPATPTAAGVTVSGRVTMPNGAGLSRVSVSVTDSDGQIRYATTNNFGYYKFENLPAGGTYVFQVSSPRYQFSNPTQVLSVSDNVTDLNFNVIE